METGYITKMIENTKTTKVAMEDPVIIGSNLYRSWVWRSGGWVL